MRESKCHLGAAMMDSPANNFYDNEDVTKHFTNIKQEPFESDETHGLGEFLNSEESVDLWAYLEQHSTLNAGQEFVSHLVECNPAAPVHHRRINGATGTIPPAPPVQQPVRITQHTATADPVSEPMHYENLTRAVDVDNMPLSTPHNQPQIVGDQADSIVPDLGSYQGYIVQQLEAEGGQMPEIEVEAYEVNSTTSTCSSVASSPGLPMSSSEQQGEQNQASSGKKKRQNPPPGTDEYKQKRARNNIAVRKCRMKTKERNKELQDKVGDLQSENSNLKKRVEMLTKELTVLKSLFTNVNKPAPSRLDKAVNL